MAKKQEDKKREKAGSEETPSGRFTRYGIVLMLLGAVALGWVSLCTFSPLDPPSTNLYAPHRPVDNAAGVVGAYAAYALRYWVGGGIYMGLSFATVASLLLVFGGRVREMSWRLIGILLLTLSTSTALYLRNSQNVDVFANGAGILGTGIGQVLLAHLSRVGAWLVLSVTFGIGVMFTADRLVLTLPKLGRKLWEHRQAVPAAMGRVAALLPAPKETKPAAKAGPAFLKPKPVLAPAKPAAAEAKLPAGKPAPEAKSDPKAAANSAPAPAAIAAPPPPKAEKAEKVETVEKPAPAPRVAVPMPPKKPELPVRKSEPRRIEPGEGGFMLPSADLLAEPTGGYIESQEALAGEKRLVLQQTLNDFNVEAEVVGHQTGPVVTMFELSLAPGVKVAQVANLANDIARTLAVPGVRVVSPLPGKDTIGIEVPNLQKEIVRIRELMAMSPESERQLRLPLYLGKDASGGPIVVDLAAMPHLLIAGTTGSGKSVCINTILMSLLMTRAPRDVRFILVDPKMVEMAAFENIPHLLCPIVNDMRRAEDILEWAVTKMDERYELLKEANVKNIVGYNRLTKEEIYQRFDVQTDIERAQIPLKLPYYVIIIDELADLIMTSSKEVEGYIIRIAQKARAVGIHLILATQRPSVNVVTGLIKSNMPCRISFRVASRQESRIVLDQNGAEVLLGQGDMLLLQPGTSNLSRAQGAYVDDSEIKSVVGTIRKGGEPAYETELLRLDSQIDGEGSGEKDELFDKAVEIVLASQRGSVSLLQRRLQVGYSRASRIIDQMADAGLLGDYKGSQARECLLTLEDWQATRASISADQSGASAANGEPTSV
jgi:S-DNA-T family DNA segregation ATPase FtsK/SpoIIIE